MHPIPFFSFRSSTATIEPISSSLQVLLQPHPSTPLSFYYLSPAYRSFACTLKFKTAENLRSFIFECVNIQLHFIYSSMHSWGFELIKPIVYSRFFHQSGFSINASYRYTISPIFSSAPQYFFEAFRSQAWVWNCLSFTFQVMTQVWNITSIEFRPFRLQFYSLSSLSF